MALLHVSMHRSVPVASVRAMISLSRQTRFSWPTLEPFLPSEKWPSSPLQRAAVSSSSSSQDKQPTRTRTRRECSLRRKLTIHPHIIPPHPIPPRHQRRKPSPTQHNKTQTRKQNQVTHAVSRSVETNPIREMCNAPPPSLRTLSDALPQVCPTSNNQSAKNLTLLLLLLRLEGGILRLEPVKRRLGLDQVLAFRHHHLLESLSLRLTVPFRGVAETCCRGNFRRELYFLRGQIGLVPRLEQSLGFW